MRKFQVGEVYDINKIREIIQKVEAEAQQELDSFDAEYQEYNDGSLEISFQTPDQEVHLRGTAEQLEIVCVNRIAGDWIFSGEAREGYEHLLAPLP